MVLVNDLNVLHLGDKKASSGQVFIKGKKGKAQDQIVASSFKKIPFSQLRVKELIAFSKIFLENYLKKKFKHSYDLKMTSISSLRTNSQEDKTSSCPVLCLIA